MNKIPVIVLAGLIAILTHTSFAASGTFSGRVWNDLDRDGIQDAGEPPMTNFPIFINSYTIIDSHSYPNCFYGGQYTDSNGYYNFSFTNATGTCDFPAYTNIEYSFVLEFGLSLPVGTSPQNVGTNDAIDCDFSSNRTVSVTNNAVVATNMDLGVFYLYSSVSMDLRVNNTPVGTPLYITNGTPVIFTYGITNTGDIFLSSLSVFDVLVEDITGSINCPASLEPGGSITFSTQVVITASVTNYAQVSAVPVNPKTCVQLSGYSPVSDVKESIIIVVTDNPLEYDDGDGLPGWWEIQYGMDPLNSNSPDINSDSDWMSNYEEYIADTIPTNGESYFPKISLLYPPPNSISLVVVSSFPSRVYSIWRSTNLLDNPQSWSPLALDKTGTGAAITFTITNNLPVAHYRTGVRLP